MKKNEYLKKQSKSKNPKPTVSIRRYRRDEADLEEMISSDNTDTEYFSYNEDDIDEFEHLQNLSESPGALLEEPEQIEEDKESFIEDTKSCIDSSHQSLTARGNKNKHYVKPEEFESLIKKYYKQGELTNDLCDCVYKIANRLSYRPNFVNYTFREEMVGDAIERMVFALSNKIYKYDPKKIGKNGKKGNAFLYFTKIAENAFINRIKIESRNREAISNYQQDVYHNLLQKGIDIGDISKAYSE